MQGDAGKIVRAVTFKFNTMIVLTSKIMAINYSLDHLFSDISQYIKSSHTK
jgi:hypothetical protein